MALPDKIDVQAGRWSKDGSPWVQVVLTGDPDSGEFSKDGSRWWGAGGGSAPVELLPVFVGSVRAAALYMGNVGITKEMLMRGNLQL